MPLTVPLSPDRNHIAPSDLRRWAKHFHVTPEEIQAAIDEGVPAHVLTASLYERFSSRGEADFANKVLSALRYQFGGHVETPAKGSTA